MFSAPPPTLRLRLGNLALNASVTALAAGVVLGSGPQNSTDCGLRDLATSVVDAAGCAPHAAATTLAAAAALPTNHLRVCGPPYLTMAHLQSPGILASRLLHCQRP